MPIDGVKNMQASYQRNELTEPSSKPKKIADFEAGTAKVRNISDKIPVFESDADENLTYNSMEQQNKDSVKRAVEEINKKAASSEVVFGIHEETNRVTIKILDKDSKKVIKEVPPEKTLDMIAKVWEIAGLLVDEKG